MRSIVQFMLVTWSLFLVGCAAVSPFAIDESMLASELRQVVADYDRKQLEAGSPVGMKLNDADVNIGPDGRDVIRLSLDGEVSLNTVLASFPVRLTLSLEAVPVYVKQEKAIYIRRLKLLESRVDSAMLSGLNLDQKAAQQGVAILAQLLEQVPVYRLNEKNMAEALVASSPLTLKVTQGRLVFALDESKH